MMMFDASKKTRTKTNDREKMAEIHNTDDDSRDQSDSHQTNVGRGCNGVVVEAAVEVAVTKI